MLPIKSWRIYYADGSTFTNKDGTWAEAPPFGVQCIVWYHDPKPFKTLHAVREDDSIYVWQGDDYKDHPEVKMGMWMDEEGYYRIHKMAFKSSEPE